MPKWEEWRLINLGLSPYALFVEGEEAGGGAPAPEPEPVPAPEPEPSEDEEKPSEDEPKPEPAASRPDDWKDRRIRQLTARLRAEEGKVRELMQRGGEQPSPREAAAAAEAEGRVAGTQAELDALVEQRAQQKSAEVEFNRRCNEVASEGQKEFGEAEFRGRVASLVSLVDGGNPQELMRYHQFLLAAMDTGKGPQLLHRLGGNLNEASRILEMTPTRMGIELARLADAPAQPHEASGAPTPIRPVGSAGDRERSRIEADDPDRADGLTTAEWMRRREAQISARRTASGGR